MQNSRKISPIYVSYAWNSESETIVNSIENEFLKRGLQIIRDKNDLGYKGRIKEFMEQIGKGKYVILVISNKYLRSESCMFELLQIFKNKDFYERIFPVVLEEVKISKAADRLELIKHWEDETDNLEEKIRALNELSNLKGVTEDLDLYTEIRNNVAWLTNILKDINTLSVNFHINDDFEQLYELIKQKVEDDFGAETTLVENQEKKVADGIVDDTGSAPNILVSLKTKLFGTTAFFEFLRKNRKGVLRFGITAVIGSLAIILVLPSFLKNDQISLKREDDVTIENPNDSDPKPILEDSSKTEMDKEDSTEDVLTAEPPKRTYNVELVIPSRMTNAKVLVDNQPAEILDRNLIFIKIRLTEKKSSHHFEINNGSESCITDKLITENVRLILCD